MQQVKEHHLILWKPWWCQQMACGFTSEFWKWGKICVTTKFTHQDMWDTTATTTANEIFLSRIGDTFAPSHFQIHYDIIDTYVDAHVKF